MPYNTSPARFAALRTTDPIPALESAWQQSLQAAEQRKQQEQQRRQQRKLAATLKHYQLTEIY